MTRPAVERTATQTADTEIVAANMLAARAEAERTATQKADMKAAAAAEGEAHLVKARAGKIAEAEARLERAKAAEERARSLTHRGEWPDPDDVPKGYGVVRRTHGEYAVRHSMSGPGIVQVRAAGHGSGLLARAAWSYDGKEIDEEDVWNIPEGAFLELPNGKAFEPSDMIVDMKILMRAVRAERSVRRAEAALNRARNNLMRCVHCGRVVPRSGICIECGDDQY